MPSSTAALTTSAIAVGVAIDATFKRGQIRAATTPLTENVVRLFDQRRQSWKRHFEWLGPVPVGRTQVGRATVAVLDINDPQRVKLRQLLMEEGEWPDD